MDTRASHGCHAADKYMGTHEDTHNPLSQRTHAPEEDDPFARARECVCVCVCVCVCGGPPSLTSPELSSRLSDTIPGTVLVFPH